MDDTTLQDLKQFIASTVAQAITSYAEASDEEITTLKHRASALETTTA